MKHKGARATYQDEYERELMQAYHRAKRDLCVLYGRAAVPLLAILIRTVNTPTSRFYVSSERARDFAAAIEHGKIDLSKMTENCREQYLEIYSRTKQRQLQHPNMPIHEIVEQVILEPAPKFYISPRSAEVKICRIRKKQKAEREKRKASDFQYLSRSSSSTPSK